MPLLLLALIVVPLVEIFVLIQVGDVIGLLPTIGLLIGVSVLGTWLIRREGARAWSAFTAAAGSGRIPGREVADGALVMFGGALLLTPGFVTDIVGLCCVLPPTRAVLRRALLGYVARRATDPGRGPRVMWTRSERGPGTVRPPRSVIDGELQPPADRPE